MPSTENTTSQYKMKFFAIEDSSLFVGISIGRFWNGWSCPYFTKDSADKIMAEFSSDDFPAWYDVERDTYCFQMEPGDSGRVSEFKGLDINIEGNLLHLYSIGSADWTWDEYNESEICDTDN